MATDPLDPEQQLRKRVTAQLSPGAAADPAAPSAAAPATSEAPIPPAPFASATTSVLSDPVTPAPPETPLSDPVTPAPAVPPGDWGPNAYFNGVTWVDGGTTDAPTYGTYDPVPPPPTPPLSDPVTPAAPVGSPDYPQMTIGPTEWPAPQPTLSKPQPTLGPVESPVASMFHSSMGAAPQQQLRQSILSSLQRRRPRRLIG